MGILIRTGLALGGTAWLIGATPQPGASGDLARLAQACADAPSVCRAMARAAAPAALRLASVEPAAAAPVAPHRPARLAVSTLRAADLAPAWRGPS